ncbi:hypothetical protein [Lysobacter tyrosinilyticus]
MALLEDRTAVFIVRVWCERGDGDSAIAEWRGSVEHIETGQRAFFRNLESVLDFMKPHLESIGIDAQQRFWEHIASAMDDGNPELPTTPIAIPIPSPTAQAAVRTPARKRR